MANVLRWGRAAGLLAAGMLLAGPALPQPAEEEPACSALVAAVLAPAAIGLPTRGAVVTGASSLDDPVNGRFCKVLGAIRPIDPAAPDIHFQLNLPVAWNGKALQIGGGGYDGALVNAESARFPPPGQPSPLKQGYATFGSDSGHVARAGEDPAAFASNPEALANFAGDQLKKTHDVAIGLIRIRYGASPRRTYFQGNSQGGHEAFIAIQRWPADYDGAVAIHPVYDFVALQTNGVLVGQAIYNTPGAWLPPEKVTLVSAAVLAACDRLDGLDDGLIGNVRACNAGFSPATLRCPGGGDTGDACLSDTQIRTLTVLGSEMPLGVRLAGDIDRFGKWPVLEGGAMSGRFNPFGKQPAKPRPPGPDDSFLHMMGDQMVRHMVMRDVSYDTLGFDPARNADALQALSRQMDASDPDLSAFQKRGGKLLMMHGTVDMAVTPYNTIAYYDRLSGRFGASLRSFVRFYMAPGFGHGDGPFQLGWDSLGALDAWVDRGVDPGAQTVVDTARTTAGRTRPLCEYPAYPRHAGAGEVNDASSFACVMP